MRGWCECAPPASSRSCRRPKISREGFVPASRRHRISSYAQFALERGRRNARGNREVNFPLLSFFLSLLKVPPCCIACVPVPGADFAGGFLTCPMYPARKLRCLAGRRTIISHACGHHGYVEEPQAQCF